MRVTSYNIQSLRGSRAGVIEALLGAAPDVVCVQEVPRFFLSAGRNRRLAAAAGLVALGSGRLAGDTSIYVRPELVVRRHRRLALSRTTGLHRRAATIATVVDRVDLDGLDGLVMTVVSVHLGLDSAERLRHAGELVEALAEFDAPYLVAGDLNEGPDGAAWGLLTGAVGPAANTEWPTLPAKAPAHIIDTAFVGAGLAMSSVAVIESTASDHRPVTVSMRPGKRRR